MRSSGTNRDRASLIAVGWRANDAGPTETISSTMEYCPGVIGRFVLIQIATKLETDL